MDRFIIIFIIGPIVVVALFFVVRRFFKSAHTHTDTHTRTRTVTEDAVQGFFAGAALSFITVLVILPNFYVTKVNGWTTMFGCGDPSSSILLRAACSITFPGPVNTDQEAMYWTTSQDGAGDQLSGAHDYVLHFPPNGLPPNNAFWSLTMSDAQNHFVANSLDRYDVGDRSGLVPNADGSIDIYIQSSTPVGHESNWLPAPSGDFILWLRAYLPGQTVLDGEYKVPSVVEEQ